MRLLYALILITGFNLPWYWYAAALAVWGAALLRPYVVPPDWDEISAWWEELRKGRIA